MNENVTTVRTAGAAGAAGADRTADGATLARRGARGPMAAALALAGVLASVPAAEARDRVRAERLTVYADVVDVRPVYREARISERPARQECWIEEQRTVVREAHSRHPAYRGSYREPYRSHRRHGGGDALVGGVIGGVVGNQLGRNSSRGGRAGATIAGAIIGSAVVNEASARSSRHRRDPYRHEVPRTTTVYETRPVERCRTVETRRSEQRLQHYDVTYRYDGRTYTTRLPRDPGATLELEVTVRPARH